MARGKNNNRGNNNNNNNKQGAGAKICSICNKPGHLAKDCLSNKKCTNCGMTGHLAAKCRSKNGTNGNNNGNQQNNNNGGKFCNFCNMKGHTDANCHKNPANQNNGNQFQSGGNGQQQNQIPMYSGQIVPFSDPCQLCGQNTHYAKDCPQRGIVPTTGQYFPQTYPQQSYAPVLAPQINNGIQWGTHPQQAGQITNDMELIGEEVSTRPAYPAPAQYAPIPSGAIYKEYYGYVAPEVACERPKMMDRDGDYIMGNSWECGECDIPARQTDGLSWRWPILQRPQIQGYQSQYPQPQYPQVQYSPGQYGQYPPAQYQSQYQSQYP